MIEESLICNVAFISDFFMCEVWRMVSDKRDWKKEKKKPPTGG